MMDEIARALHEEHMQWYEEIDIDAANLRITSILNEKYQYWHE